MAAPAYCGHEQEPDKTDTFFMRKHLPRWIRVNGGVCDGREETDESSSGKTTVDDDTDANKTMTRRQIAALDAEKAAAFEEKARKKAERKEKDKIWKQQQKELKAARRAAAVAAAAEGNCTDFGPPGLVMGSGVIPPRSPEKSLMGRSAAQQT